MSELKPCPFCGGEAWMRISDAPQILRVECRWCHAATTSFVADSIGEKEAVEAWNTRHVETCHDANTRFNAWVCSECDSTVLLMFDDYGEPTLNIDGTASTPNYCPNCGKKVES